MRDLLGRDLSRDLDNHITGHYGEDQFKHHQLKEDTMTDSIKQVLMERDGLTEQEAELQIEEAKTELHKRLEQGELPFDFCEEQFGLEPDYLIDLL
jgi:hypothetical protein